MTWASRWACALAATARDEQRLGLPDDDQLAFALEQGRVLVTQDRDFVRMHWAGAQHAGIVYASKRLPIGVIVEWIVAISGAYEAEEFAGHLETVRRS